ncbi:PLP-dependent aminotransferase family protein [Fulvivirgaceae bacterium BMA12]|uniref:PLP-dependent aminotransferase family protein n=1 Tax=Agaribacillus aureus TaxID=3051825 RepID=A0ABT8LE46_9BACT|nr:PLP-dependent aminotransferase family protein [Fulvivirgaceae bacterium BMA12]
MLPYEDLIKPDKNSTKAVYIQIATKFIELIQKGKIRSGAKLPGSRQLALKLGINRNTMNAAYDELIAQGYALSLQRKGVFVVENLPEIKGEALDESLQSKSYHGIAPFAWNEQLQTIPLVSLQEYQLVIDDGFPDVRLAPIDSLMREYRSLSRRSPNRKFLKYGPPGGSHRLKMALFKHLADTRGINIAPENMLITRGCQMGFYIAAKLLIMPGDYMVVGTSNYFAVDATFRHFGARLLRVPVDENGMDIDKLEALCKKKKIKGVYVIPHHHHPTMVTLSTDRRMKLLQLAAAYNFAIIEDDYDFDFHYDTNPILPLASIDPYGHVLYVGSITKTVAPGLRMGFLIGPEKFIDKAARFRLLIDRQGDTLMEEAMASLYELGEIDGHLRRSLKIYRERRNVFCHLLEEKLNDAVTFEIPRGGLGIWTVFDKSIDLTQLFKRSLKMGLMINDPSIYNNEVFNENGVRLGFASVNETEINRALGILESAL